MDERPSVFVVEDHPVVRLGVESLIRESFHFVGSADTATSAIEMIEERTPDLVLLDVHFAGGGGATVAERIKNSIPGIKVLALSISANRDDVVRMFKSGVDGYLVKTTDPPDLLRAISETLAGGRPLSREIAGHLLAIDADVPESAGIERLTPREKEITTLIARGYTYREIASRLDPPISTKTLESHVAHIFEKLGTASRHEVARIAYETGFVTPEPSENPPWSA